MDVSLRWNHTDTFVNPFLQFNHGFRAMQQQFRQVSPRLFTYATRPAMVGE
jgi:hypothetical protein